MLLSCVSSEADDMGVEKPVGLFSKKLISCQLNYSVIEKESLTLILELELFNGYDGSRTPSGSVYRP